VYILVVLHKLSVKWLLVLNRLLLLLGHHLIWVLLRHLVLERHLWHTWHLEHKWIWLRHLLSLHKHVIHHWHSTVLEWLLEWHLPWHLRRHELRLERHMAHLLLIEHSLLHLLLLVHHWNLERALTLRWGSLIHLHFVFLGNL
jgi:hypothetical protein